MSITRAKALSTRISEDLFAKLKIYAERKKMSISEAIADIIAEGLEGEDRIDLLVRNIHEEVLQLQDMLTLAYGFSYEVFVTLLARTYRPLDAEQKKAMKEFRKKARKGTDEYLQRVTEKILNGENIWGYGQDDAIVPGTDSESSQKDDTAF